MEALGKGCGNIVKEKRQIVTPLSLTHGDDTLGMRNGQNWRDLKVQLDNKNISLECFGSSVVPRKSLFKK